MQRGFLLTLLFSHYLFKSKYSSTVKKNDLSQPQNTILVYDVSLEILKIWTHSQSWPDTTLQVCYLYASKRFVIQPVIWNNFKINFEKITSKLPTARYLQITWKLQQLRHCTCITKLVFILILSTIYIYIYTRLCSADDNGC